MFLLPALYKSRVMNLSVRIKYETVHINLNKRLALCIFQNKAKCEI